VDCPHEPPRTEHRGAVAELVTGPPLRRDDRRGLAQLMRPPEQSTPRPRHDPGSGWRSAAPTTERCPQTSQGLGRSGRRARVSTRRACYSSTSCHRSGPKTLLRRPIRSPCRGCRCSAPPRRGLLRQGPAATKASPGTPVRGREERRLGLQLVPLRVKRRWRRSPAHCRWRRRAHDDGVIRDATEKKKRIHGAISRSFEEDSPAAPAASAQHEDVRGSRRSIVGG